MLVIELEAIEVLDISEPVPSHVRVSLAQVVVIVLHNSPKEALVVFVKLGADGLAVFVILICLNV